MTTQFLQLRDRRAPLEGPLLVADSGRSVSTQVLRRRISRLAKRAGITRSVTPHMLRHSAATQLLEAGVDIRFVQKLLGHSSIATTQIYADVRDGSLKAVLARADPLARLGRS